MEFSIHLAKDESNRDPLFLLPRFICALAKLFLAVPIHRDGQTAIFLIGFRHKLFLSLFYFRLKPNWFFFLDRWLKPNGNEYPLSLHAGWFAKLFFAVGFNRRINKQKNPYRL